MIWGLSFFIVTGLGEKGRRLLRWHPKIGGSNPPLAVYKVRALSGVGKGVCCRAHDPEVDGSNPSPANIFLINRVSHRLNFRYVDLGFFL